MPDSTVPIIVHRSRRSRLLRFIVVVLVSILAWLLFEYGRYRGGYDVQAEAEVRDALAQRIVSLQTERDRLKQRMAIVEQAARVDAKAYETIKRELADEQAEMQELRQEVGFYRSIVNDGDLKRGLYIQNLLLQPDGGGRTYRYRLILTRYMETKRLARGHLRITLEGRRAGQIERLVVAAPAKQSRFRFRYFEEVTGSFEVPAGFEPARVVVRAIPTGKGHGKSVERSFEWNDLIAELEK